MTLLNFIIKFLKSEQYISIIDNLDNYEIYLGKVNDLKRFRNHYSLAQPYEFYVTNVSCISNFIVIHVDHVGPDCGLFSNDMF